MMEEENNKEAMEIAQKMQDRQIAKQAAKRESLHAYWCKVEAAMKQQNQKDDLHL